MNFLKNTSKYCFLILSILISTSTLLFAQKTLEAKDFEGYRKSLKSEFNIKVKKPKEFTLLDDYIVMVKIRKEKEKQTVNLYGPVFMAENKNCLLMYSALPRDHSKLNQGWRLSAGGESSPRGLIKGELGTALGSYYGPHHPLNRKLSNADFKKYVTTISGREAKKMFNADSVYIYDIPGADSIYILNNKRLEHLRKNKFPHSTRIFIYKKFRGIIDVTFFFTDKGKEKEEAYIRQLRKKIWYKRAK